MIARIAPLLCVAASALSFAPAVLAHDHSTPSPSDRIAAIEAAHGGEVYNRQQGVRADFKLDFGSLKMIAEMTFLPSVGKARMDVEGIGTMIFDGESAWVSPATAMIPGAPARFHIRTWPYFAAVPFKLDDPGTHHSDAGKVPFTSADDLRTGTKITFDAGVGDAPDDWYIAFTDDQGRMDGLAYIVTATRSKEEAEAQPSIILYSNFIDVDGVTLSTRWDFHYWSLETGIGEAKASAELSNIRFVTPTPGIFEKPDDAVESVMR